MGGPQAHDHSEVEEIVRLAEAKGKVIGVRLAPADEEDVMTPRGTPAGCHSERSEESRSEPERIGAQGEIPRYARNDTTSRRRRDASIPGPLP